MVDDSAQHYAVSEDVGLTPVTRWNLRGFYGKYDESSISDVLSQPNSINSAANLNQRLYRFDSSVSHVLGGRQLLQGGLEWTQDEYRGYNRVLGDNAGQGIDMADLWINDRISLHERFVLTLGGRFNHHSLYGSHFVPRASGLLRITENLRIRGTFGRGFRAPDLGQLFYRFQNPLHYYQVIGNNHLAAGAVDDLSGRFRLQRGNHPPRHQLLPEQHPGSDPIGVYRPAGRTPDQMQALLQTHDISSEFNPALNRYFYLYQNVDNVYTSGIESKIEFRPTRDLMVSTGYTYMEARDKDTDAFLSGRHRHHGNFRIFYSPSRLGGLRTNLRGTYFSKWPVSGRGGTLLGDAYQIWDWYVAKPLSRGMELYFVVDNLFDSRDSGLESAQPAFLRADPGRLVRVGMRWNFKSE